MSSFVSVWLNIGNGIFESQNSTLPLQEFAYIVEIRNQPILSS